MSEQELHEVKIADIEEVQTFLLYAIVTFKSGYGIIITVPAAHQLMQMIGDERLLSVTVKYGDRKHAETIH